MNNDNEASAKPTAFDYGWRIFWLITSLFCAVMLPYVIYLSMQDQTRLDTGGQTAIGVVTGKVCRTMSGGGDRQTCRTKVKFSVPDGRVFAFTDPRPIQVAEGQQVKIRYILSADSVYDAQIVLKSGEKINWLQWGIISALALIFGGIAIVCIRSLHQMATGQWKGG